MFISVGFGNFVSYEKIFAVLSAESSPAKRLVRNAKENNNLIDATCGRKTQSVLAMDSGHIVLSALDTGSISARSAME